MPAITNAMVARDSNLVRRSWPSENVGVMVVFCIVGVVALGLTSVWVSKFLAARKMKKQSNSG